MRKDNHRHGMSQKAIADMKETLLDLKLCPYCGGDPERDIDALACPLVRCKECHAEVAAVWVGATQADADARWNRRIGDKEGA